MFSFNKPFNKISLGLLLLLMLGLVGLFYSSAVRKGDALKGTDSNVRYPSELKTVSPATQSVEALSRYIYESDPVSYFELEGFEQEFIEMYDVDPQEVESLYQSLFLGKN